MAVTQIPLPPDEIVRQLRRRDENALRVVFAQYGPALNGLIVRIVRDPRVAEEVLQDTLLKIWNKIELYDPDHSRLFTWMMGIARNTAIDHTRLRGFQASQKSEDLDTSVPDHATSDLQAAKVDVATLTADLDPKYLDVLDKMYLQGYSTSAAAEELGVPLGTVKTRLRTALILLRGKIKHEKELFLALTLLLIAVLLLWLLR